MGRLIKLLTVFSILIVIVSCGNTLLDVVEGKVAAANGITVDFQYNGPYEFSADYPVILKFIPNPFSGDVSIFSDYPDTKLIKPDQLPVWVDR